MRLDAGKKEINVRGRVRTRPLYVNGVCKRNVQQTSDYRCYRLGDLSTEPEEPDDVPDAPPPIAPDEPDEPVAPDEPRDPLAPDPLEDLLLTPNAWAVFSSIVPVMVKPSDF